MSGLIEFSIGDSVVYPFHGVGRIVAQETQKVASMELSVFVVSFEKDKMTLRIPVKRANAEGLRQLSSQEDLGKALAVLKGKPKRGNKMWSRRDQEQKAAINSGDLSCIAGVVRDLRKNIEDPDCSYSERQMYESALSRLVEEYAAIEAIPMPEAYHRVVDLMRLKLEEAA